MSEVVIHKNDLGDIASRVGPRCHGDRAVSLAKRQNIIHAVARHCHGMARPAKRKDELALLLGGHATKHAVL